MKKYLAATLAAKVVMVALDMLWLGVVAKTMCQQAIGQLMAEQPNTRAAVAFYAVSAGGLMLFAVSPQADSTVSGQAVLMGALFGFVAYAADDLSNLATLRNWPGHLALVDMGWGTATARCPFP